MSELAKRIAALSPEQRAVFERRLKQKGLSPLKVQAIPRRTSSDSLPLSYAQERLWFLDQLEPGSPLYNGPSAVRVTGPIRTDALLRSVDAFVSRHEALRTTFVTVDGRPIQVIAAQLSTALPVVDLQTLHEDEREDAALRLTTAEVRRPFDLARGPLLRALLLRLSATEHILLMTMHHIISDGWSTELLVQEIATLYDAFVSGRPSPLPELPIQYADFAIWQRAWLERDVIDSQLAYWEERLAGAPPVLNLPADRPRPAIQSYQGAVLTFALPDPLYVALATLSQHEETTLFMTLLAAFQALLARYSGQDDILIGSAVGNRTRSEVAGVIGFFANNLVLRTDLSGNPSFRTLLGRVREVCLGAYAHQDLPFELLVKALNPDRSLSHAPLFQVSFLLQNVQVPAFDIAGLTLRPIAVDTGTAKADLSLLMWEGEGHLTGMLEYATDLFDAATIARLTSHFQNLLVSASADPDVRFVDLPLLSDGERRQLLLEWNATAADYPKNTSIHALFVAQAARTPDTVALVFDGRTTNTQHPTPNTQHLTYDELDRRTNQLAHYLRARGVGPEVRAGICMERSLELVIGVLGVLKAGGAYVPLDPTYPAERLAFMLADAQTPVLLTLQHIYDVRFAMYDLAPPAQGDPTIERHTAHTAKPVVICLDDDWEAIRRERSDNSAQQTLAEHLLYVIYTSGSTGRPKGVAMRQGALANLLWWQSRGTALPATARTLQFASLNFDVSFQEIFATLCFGGTLILIAEERRRDPITLLHLLADEAVERLFLPFVALQHLAETAAAYPQITARPREIISAGEQLQITGAIVAWLGRLPGCVLQNHYGPSESHAVTALALDGRPEEWPALPSIGRPISNIQIYLLDRHLRPTPIVVPGELFIGGAGLARGYLNRPDLTAERFIPNPFAADTETRRHGDTETGDETPTQSSVLSPQSSTRLYRTGDLARYRADGTIEFLGRDDQQVKLRGYRIELGEIETMLAQHPAVRDVAVLVREDTPGEQRLVAYVGLRTEPKGLSEEPLGTTQSSVLSPQSSVLAELRDFLQAHLPEYMIPSAFVVLQALPLTPSGKLDRRALPAPDGARPAMERAFVAPRTPLETVIAGIWARVLGLTQLGVHDHFFDLGGHSLLATRVMAQMREALQVELPLQALFETPTVAGIAQALLRDTSRRAEIERTAQLLLELDQLSEDDVEMMLAESPTTPARGSIS